MLTGCADRQARLWDLSGKSVSVSTLPHAGDVYQVAFNADGSRFLTAGGEAVRLWQTASTRATD